MYKSFRALFLFSGVLMGSQLQAQQMANSPYSRFGVGDVAHGTSNVRNMSMGQVGVASASGAIINDLNPALLYYNRYVTFEASVASKLVRLSDRTNNQVDGGANLGSLKLAIPVSRRWTAAVGLRPFSQVSYHTFQQKAVAGAPNVSQFEDYRGTGGLNEVFFAHGVRLTEDLTAGVSGSYLFGTIDQEASTVVVDQEDATIPEKSVVHNNSKYSGFLFKGGVNYWKKVGSKYTLGVAATYTAQSVLRADRQVSLERRLLDETLIYKLVTDSADGYTTIPQAYQVGFSLGSNKNWSAAADYSLYKGTDFRGFNLEKNGGAQVLGNTHRIGLGGEYSPDPASISSYLKRITYRLGGYYGTSEIIASTGSQELNDMAVTWGFTLPIGRGVRPPDYTQALINAGFVLGMQKAPGTGLKEEYFKASIGVTFTNQWFIKRRFD